MKLNPLISLVLAISLLAAVTSCNGGKTTSVFITSTPDSDFIYQINGNMVTITGYIGLSTDVIIPKSIDGKSVNSIGDDAFSGHTRLTGITIPESIRSIGDNAFHACYRLTDITIPEGVISIGDRAFWLCSNLIAISVPDSVTSIGYEAFGRCSPPFMTGWTVLVTLCVGPVIICSPNSYAHQWCVENNYSRFKLTQPLLTVN